jgi:heme exporter protein C
MSDLDLPVKNPNSRPINSQGIFARLWNSFLQTVGTQQFYQTFNPWVKWLTIVAVLLFVVGSIWGLAFAPHDYLQGDSYRIIFVHVPSASLALSIYLALAVLGAINLIWKIKTASIVAQASAPVGLVLCIVALVTGAIWGKPTWGAYWVWDGRLTSMLILAFLYVGVVALFHAYDNTANQGKAAAILSIIGAINLPIIKYSVVWWNTLHQGSTFSLTSAPKMPPSMYMPLLILFFAFCFLVVALVIYRSCTLILMRERQRSWVKTLINTRLATRIK